jgi:hypothetical protein
MMVGDLLPIDVNIASMQDKQRMILQFPLLLDNYPTPVTGYPSRTGQFIPSPTNTTVYTGPIRYPVLKSGYYCVCKSLEQPNSIV